LSKKIFFDSETSNDRHSAACRPKRSSAMTPARCSTAQTAAARGFELLMAKRKKDLNDLAGCQRSLSQGNCAPNHYWNKTTNQPDWPALWEQMEREVKLYGMDSWKWVIVHTIRVGSGAGL